MIKNEYNRETKKGNVKCRYKPLVYAISSGVLGGLVDGKGGGGGIDYIPGFIISIKNNSKRAAKNSLSPRYSNIKHVSIY